MSSRRRRAIGIPSVGMLGGAHIIAMSPRGEAGEEHNEGREEEQDHGGELGPHGRAELGLAAALVLAVVVDVVANGADPHEISRHDHDGEDPGESGDQGGEQRAADAGSECEEEGNECQAANDGVQDHDAGKRFGGILSGGGEVGRVNGVHDRGRVVADVLLGAVILIRVCRCDVENAIAKCAKGDRGVAQSRGVGECHLQQGDVMDDRRGDGGDEEEDRGCEEEERSYMVKNSGTGHLDGIKIGLGRERGS